MKLEEDDFYRFYQSAKIVLATPDGKGCEYKKRVLRRLVSLAWESGFAEEHIDTDWARQ